MFKLYKTFTITFIASMLISSCATNGQNEFDAYKQNAYKDVPTRSDNWFDKSIRQNTDDDMDPYADLERKDFTDNVKKPSTFFDDKLKENDLQAASIEDYIEPADEINIADDKLVSISINETIPLKDAIVELARRAEIDVEIDNNIDKRIIFIAKDRPFSDVIKRICAMANLMYSYDDGVLKIRRDTPYIATYKFDMLDLKRNSTSSVTTNLTVGGSGGEGGGTASSGSTSALNIESGDGDIWTVVQTGISGIVANYEAFGAGSTAGGDSSGGAATASAGASGSASGSSSAGGAGATANGGVLSIDKSAGSVSVLATSKQHKAVKEYLDNIHMSLTSQVMIEAKVLEVALNDQYKAGVEWTALLNKVSIGTDFKEGTFSPALAEDGLSIGKITGAANLFGNDKFSLTATVNLLQQFGTARALSSPRINAMNNQYAVLNFSNNEVYFDIDISEEEEEDETTGQKTIKYTYTSAIKTVPVGVILTIQPSIDLKRNEITMNVHPTLTKISNRIPDPVVSLIVARANAGGAALGDIKSEIPEVQVREMDTVLRVKDGEIMVIGGLLEERSNNEDSGVPGLSSVPYIGNAFKNTTKNFYNVETVIFLKANIVPGKGVTVEDKEFYNKFISAKKGFNVN